MVFRRSFRPSKGSESIHFGFGEWSSGQAKIQYVFNIAEALDVTLDDLVREATAKVQGPNGTPRLICLRD